MARGEDTRHHQGRKVGRTDLSGTAESMFGAMDTLKAQLIAQGRYIPEDESEENENA
jgi:hypothetical protein